MATKNVTDDNFEVEVTLWLNDDFPHTLRHKVEPNKTFPIPFDLKFNELP